MLAGVALLVVVWGGAGCTGEARDGAPATEEKPDGDALAGEEVDAEVLLRETASGVRDHRRAILRSQVEWKAFWEEVHALRTPVPEAPPVDFDERIVVVAAMGERPTGGHSVAVEDVKPSEEGYLVVVREVSPGEGCVVTQALTQPVTAVALRNGEREVRFKEKTSEGVC